MQPGLQAPAATPAPLSRVGPSLGWWDEGEGRRPVFKQYSS